MDNDHGVTARGSDAHEPPELVYHYTNGPGLLGIMSHSQLWLGDVQFMNDAQELQYARDLALPLLNAKADALWPRDTGSLEQSAEWAQATIIRGAISYLEVDVDEQRFHVYAACFCEKPDLLSQWRGYAGSGGYSIGFRTQSLISLCTSEAEKPAVADRYRFVRMLYGKEQADSSLNALVGRRTAAVGHVGAAGWTELMERVLPWMSTVKHHSFAEEQEWRLLGIKWEIDPDVKFRPGQLGLIPYRVIDLPRDAIVEVVVGPGSHPELRISAVKQLLNQLERDGVQVRSSDTPFRP